MFCNGFKIMCKYLNFLIVAVLICCNSNYLRYNGEYGFSDVSFGNRIEVTYVGSSYMNRTDVKKYALFRVAEIANNKGFQYIKITKEKESVQHKNIDYPFQIEHVDHISPNQELRTKISPYNNQYVTNPEVTITCVCQNVLEEGFIKISELLEQAKEEKINIE